jgi:hypothetical protein
MNLLKSFDNADSRKKLWLFILFLLQNIFIFNTNAQQVPDTAYKFSFRQTAYQQGKGPLILIDGAHHNFHTKEGGFFAFSRLLEQDGYLVKSLNQSAADSDVLNECKILVIANALNEANVEKWFLPTPSAFSTEEIARIKQWVAEGGSLLLIADHMPFAGAAYELGKAFGFEFINGFASSGEGSWPPSVFSVKSGTLQNSPVTSGLKKDEKIDSVATFTGSAFKAPPGSNGVLSFQAEHQSLQPDTAWRFNKNTPMIKLDGYLQGALLSFGKGKVAVFGEAAMFTAQLVNGNFRVGINSEFAPQNAQFTLNLVHWLNGVKAYSGDEMKQGSK